jgi:hypothetical protein
MNVCAAKINADRARRFRQPEDFKTGDALVRSFTQSVVSEIVMSRKKSSVLRAAIAAAMLWPFASALASQGPGAGIGTAGNFTQSAMAVLVYGMAALIVGAGLIGALRRR